MPSAQIYISGNPEANIVEMLLAYLVFYLPKECKPAIYGGISETLHPLAIQVMREDGVDLPAVTKQENSNNQTIVLTYATEADALAPERMHFSFADPLADPNYDLVVQNYYTLREEIKKISIEIAGKILQEDQNVMAEKVTGN
jgi:hypothetical protein